MKKNELHLHSFRIRWFKVRFLTRNSLLFFMLLYGTSIFSMEQKIKVSLQMKDVSFDDVARQIEKLSDFKFLYDDSHIEKIKGLTLDYSNVELEQILKDCLAGTGLNYRIMNNTIVIVKQEVQSGDVKEKIVTGTVKDMDGNPVPGASVIIDGTQIGLVTDVDGKFSINVAENDNVRLRISFIGLKTKIVDVSKTDNVNVILEEEVSHLDEVVAVGYGTTKAKDMTGAVSRLGKNVLETAPMGASIQSMLQGRAPGVNVMISSASPTSPVSVIIRGSSSLLGDSQPLWVIDGVPEYSAGTSGNVTNTLYNLNLSDVESVDILKDASATAIYGSRGANGVILVTTKRGRKGMKPTLDFSARYGIQTLDANKFGVLNAEQYIRLSKAAVRSSFYTKGALDYFTRQYIDEKYFISKFNNSQFDLESLTDDFFLSDAYYDGDEDWWNLMTRNAATQEYSLGIRGGTTDASYNASVFYKDQKGVVKGGSSKLVGGSFNFDSSIRDILRFKLSIRGTSRTTNDKDDMISTILKMRPDFSAYTEDGDINMISYYVQNPLFLLKNKKEAQGKDFTGTLGLEWDIVTGLTLRTTGTVKYGINKSDNYTRKYYEDGLSTANVSKNESYTYIWDNTLTYIKSLNEHNFVGMGGFSIEKYETDGLSAAGSDFPDDEVLTNLTSAANRTSIGSSKTSNALVSTFARIEYKWKDRYLATMNFRADGSSKFGPDKRWGYFPSGALAWIVTEEDFMKRFEKSISYLKLRASIGKTGSQSLGNYDWRTLMGAAVYNGLPGIKPSSLGNDILQWESQVQKEIGLDFGFLGDRLRGTIGYYQKKVDNLLYSDPVPFSSSFTTVTQNIGSIKNNGFEFDIRYDIINNPVQDLVWDFDFNIARNITKLEKLNSVDEYFGGGPYQYFKIKEGGKTGVFYGYKYAGRLFRTNEELVALKEINPATGEQRYYRTSDLTERQGDLYIMDLNGDGIIDADNDRTEIGNANPDFFGGFGTTVYWKGFMFNATFTYSVGADRFWDEEKNTAGDINVYNTSKEVLNSWVLNPGVDKGYPRTTYYGLGGNSIITDRYIHDASFLRMSALNISYRLPKKLLGNSMLDSVDFTFQATNLFTWTKYPGMDPQGNFSTTYSAFYSMGIDYSTYPSARTYNIGIKITLK